MKREFIAANEIGLLWTPRRIHCHTYACVFKFCQLNGMETIFLCTYIAGADPGGGGGKQGG